MHFSELAAATKTATRGLRHSAKHCVGSLRPRSLSVAVAAFVLSVRQSRAHWADSPGRDNKTRAQLRAWAAEPAAPLTNWRKPPREHPLAGSDPCTCFVPASGVSCVSGDSHRRISLDFLTISHDVHVQILSSAPTLLHQYFTASMLTVLYLICT